MGVPTSLKGARERAGLGRRIGYSGKIVSAVETGVKVLAADAAGGASAISSVTIARCTVLINSRSAEDLDDEGRAQIGLGLHELAQVDASNRIGASLKASAQKPSGGDTSGSSPARASSSRDRRGDAMPRAPRKPAKPRRRARLYVKALPAIAVAWEALDFCCAERLHPALAETVWLLERQRDRG